MVGDKDHFVKLCPFLLEEADKLRTNSFFSQSNTKYQELISLVEAHKVAIVRSESLDGYKEINIGIRTNLAIVALHQRNFQEIIFQYEYCVKSLDCHYSTIMLYYIVAMMATGQRSASNTATDVMEYLCTDLITRYKANRYMTNGIESIFVKICVVFITEFCRKRSWNEALNFHNKVSSFYLEAGKNVYDSSLILSTIYIERYRIEARKRPAIQQNKISASLYKYISHLILGKDDIMFMSKNHPYRHLLCAQWLYLNRNGTYEQSINIEELALSFVHVYVDEISMSSKSTCQGCGQKSTCSDPLLLCSNCHVTFCNIDHQRSSWKRNSCGTGIGHEMLCPLLKAYRKFENARNAKEEAKLEKYRLRYRGACEKFLSETLGLRDLCFSQKFVDEYGEVHKRALTRAYCGYELSKNVTNDVWPLGRVNNNDKNRNFYENEFKKKMSEILK